MDPWCWLPWFRAQERKAILVESCCKMCFCDCHACQNLCSSEVVLAASLPTRLSSKKNMAQHEVTMYLKLSSQPNGRLFASHLFVLGLQLNPNPGAYGIGKALPQRSRCDLYATGHSKFRMSRRTAAFEHQHPKGMEFFVQTQRDIQLILKAQGGGDWRITCDATRLGIFYKISILTLALT